MFLELLLLIPLNTNYIYFPIRIDAEIENLNIFSTIQFSLDTQKRE